MSVKIRLQRKGRRKAPFYQIVIADARASRDGRFIEKIGTYNPLTVPATIELDAKKAITWLYNGAQPTDTVRGILRYKGVTYYKWLLDGVRKGKVTQEQADEKYRAFVAAKEEAIAKRKETVAIKKAEFKKATDGTPKPRREKVVEAPVVEEVVEAVVETPAPVVEEVVEAVVETPVPVVEEVVEAVVEAPAPVVEEVVEAVAETPAPVVEEVVEAVAEVPAPEDEEPKSLGSVIIKAQTVTTVETVITAEEDDDNQVTPFVDNVILIDGIGPKTAELLNEAGITKLSQIVEMSDDELAAIAEKANVVGDHISQEWKIQAQEMIDGKPPRSKADRALARKLAKES